NAKVFYGDIQPDGTYTVSGVPVGQAKVVVSSPDPRIVGGKKNPRGDKQRAGREDADVRPELKIDPKNWFPIPPKYSDPSQTDLTVTVDRGQTAFDIKLVE